MLNIATIHTLDTFSYGAAAHISSVGNKRCELVLWLGETALDMLDVFSSVPVIFF